MIDKDKLQIRCWNYALEAYGTGFIFDKRAKFYRMLIRGLNTLGIIVPVIAGSILLTFGEVALFPWVIIPAGILLIAQVIGSVWSLVAGWDDSYSYSIESMNSNYRLAASFEKLAANPPTNETDYILRYELLEQEDQFRRSEDNKQGIKEKETRMGMRASLRKYRRECVGCGQVPTSMKPTKCDVCGNF